MVDASLVGKWHLVDEPQRLQAIQVQQDYESGRIALLAPNHFRYEVVSLIRRAVLHHRLTEDEGRAAMLEFLDWRIPVVDMTPLISDAYDHAFRFSASFYDSLYLALAQSQGLSLVHADARLHNALGGRFPLEAWIEDYQRA